MSFISSGQEEIRFPNGTVQISFADGSVKKIFVDGSEEIKFPDGTQVQVAPNGDRTLLMPNGQKEFHSSNMKVPRINFCYRIDVLARFLILGGEKYLSKPLYGRQLTSGRIWGPPDRVHPSETPSICCTYNPSLLPGPAYNAHR